MKELNGFYIGESGWVWHYIKDGKSLCNSFFVRDADKLESLPRGEMCATCKKRMFPEIPPCRYVEKHSKFCNGSNCSLKKAYKCPPSEFKIDWED